MSFLRVALLLVLAAAARGSPQLIGSCRDLKTTIEGAASASSALVLNLRSTGSYNCKESIRVGAAQSVVITGGGESLSQVFVSLSPGASLFVNEGSLKLSNIGVELGTARDEVVGAAGVSDRRSRWRGIEQQRACPPAAGLIWNSGRAVVEDSHVFESGPSVSQRRCREEGARQGRVVSERLRGESKDEAASMQPGV